MTSENGSEPCTFSPAKKLETLPSIERESLIAPSILLISSAVNNSVLEEVHTIASNGEFSLSSISYATFKAVAVFPIPPSPIIVITGYAPKQSFTKLSTCFFRPIKPVSSKSGIGKLWCPTDSRIGTSKLSTNLRFADF